MSHFSVLAVLPDFDGNAQALTTDTPALAELMAPYSETDEDYFEFIDKTDDWRQEWQDNQEDVIDADHYLYQKYDGQIGDTWAEHHNLETFDECVDFLHEDHIQKGDRVGYMANPNAKYDYYRIGGRWRGHLPVVDGVLGDKTHEWQDKPWRDEVPEEPAGFGDADIAYLNDLDRGRLPEIARENLDAYWETLEAKLERKPYDAIRDPIYRLIKELGYPIGEEDDAYFRRLRQSDDTTLPNWGPEGPPTKEQLREEYMFAFQWRTHSVVHPDHGWEQKAERGMWGSKNNDYLYSWPDRFDRYNPDDLLVILDCPI